MAKGPLKEVDSVRSSSKSFAFSQQDFDDFVGPKAFGKEALLLLTLSGFIWTHFSGSANFISAQRRELALTSLGVAECDIPLLSADRFRLPAPCGGQFLSMR